MPRYKYNELEDERIRLEQHRADLVELVVNLEADTTGIIREDAARDSSHEYNRLNRGEQRDYINNLVEEERRSIRSDIEDIYNQLLTVRSLMDNWREPTQPPPPPPLIRLSDLADSFDYGQGSPDYSPPGTPPYVPDSPPYAPGSPLSPVPSSPTGSQRSLHLSDLNITNEDEIVDVDPTPPGSPNRTPPPRSPQVPSAPRRRGPVGGTKKRKGKKRKATKKKPAKKGNKTAKKGNKTKKR